MRVWLSLSAWEAEQLGEDQKDARETGIGSLVTIDSRCSCLLMLSIQLHINRVRVTSN